MIAADVAAAAAAAAATANYSLKLQQLIIRHLADDNDVHRVLHKYILIGRFYFATAI